METLTEKHLDEVTVDNMLDFQSDAFSLYASTKGVKLGFNGFGQFTVKSNKEDYVFNNPAMAIKKYADLVRSKS